MLWACRDSNPEPSDYESPALTIELQAHIGTAVDGGTVGAEADSAMRPMTDDRRVPRRGARRTAQHFSAGWTTISRDSPGGTPALGGTSVPIGGDRNRDRDSQ